MIGIRSYKKSKGIWQNEAKFTNVFTAPIETNYRRNRSRATFALSSGYIHEVENGNNAVFRNNDD